MTTKLSLIPEDDRRIQFELKKYAKLCDQVITLEAKYQLMLEQIKEANPEFAQLAQQLEDGQEVQDKTKKAVESYCREAQVSVRGHGISATYSNPMAVEYDAVKLLDIHPAANDIPRLLKTVVDLEVMEAASAAGMVPEGVAEHCRVETPRYSNGRVQIKKLKKK